MVAEPWLKAALNTSFRNERLRGKVAWGTRCDCATTSPRRVGDVTLTLGTRPNSGDPTERVVWWLSSLGFESTLTRVGRPHRCVEADPASRVGASAVGRPTRACQSAGPLEATVGKSVRPGLEGE